MTDAEIERLVRERGGTVRSLRPLPATKLLHKDAQGRNKTEARYGDHVLDSMRSRGEILDYKFEYINFRLASPSTGEKCFYRPDYIVVRPDATLEAHEVKGFMRDGAREKYLMFLRNYPWIPLFMVRAKGRNFRVERFGVRGGRP